MPSFAQLRPTLMRRQPAAHSVQQLSHLSMIAPQEFGLQSQGGTALVWYGMVW